MIVFLILAMVLAVVTSQIMLTQTEFMAYSFLHSQGSQDRELLVQWKHAISRDLKPLSAGQELAAPYGYNDPTDANADTNPDIPHQLPPQHIPLSTKGAGGYNIIYCPVSDDTVNLGAGNDELPVWTGATEGDGSSYLTANVDDALGNSYVIESDSILDPSMAGRGIVAMLIMPYSTPGPLPTCSDVTYDSGKGVYQAPGSMVEVVTKNLSDSAALSQIQLTTSDFAAGITISDMLQSWPATQPTRFVVNVDDARDFGANIDLTNASGDSLKTIVLRNSGGGSIGSSTAQQLSVEGISLTIEGLSVASNVDIGLDNSSLSLINSSVGAINAQQSNITIKGISTVSMGASSTYSSGIRVSQGSLKLSASTLHGSSQLTVASDAVYSLLIDRSQMLTDETSALIIDQGSTGVRPIHVSGQSSVSISGDLSITNSLSSAETMISIDRGSSFVVDHQASAGNSMTVSADTTGDIFSSFGDLILLDVELSIVSSVNAYIAMDQQSRLTLENTTLGSVTNSSAIGVNALGGTSIGGSGSQIYATDCWNGDLFSETASDTTGNSVPSGPDTIIVNQSNWQCN